MLGHIIDMINNFFSPVLKSGLTSKDWDRTMHRTTRGPDDDLDRVLDRAAEPERSRQG